VEQISEQGPCLSVFATKMFFGCLPRMIQLFQLSETKLLVILVIAYHIYSVYIHNMYKY